MKLFKKYIDFRKDGKFLRLYNPDDGLGLQTYADVYYVEPMGATPEENENYTDVLFNNVFEDVYTPPAFEPYAGDLTTNNTYS